MELFKLLGTIAVNNDEANKSIDETTDKAESSSDKMVGAFKKIGAAVVAAFAVDKIVNFGKAIVGASAEVAAEEAAFTQIMGNYADTASEKVSKIADATGIVDSRLTPYMTSMTAKFKGLGYDIDDATDLASTGLNIAADAAAFWDKSIEDSMSALNSFVNGNYEGGEAIGLFANETTLAAWASDNLGLKWKDLSEKEKQFARLEFAKAMQEASGAAGQAAKESGAYANVQGNLNEKWRQFKAQIGEPLLQNIVIPAMQWLGNFIENKLMPGFESLKVKIGQLNDFYHRHKSVIDAVGIAIGVLVSALAALKAGEIAYYTSLKITAAIEKAQIIGKNLLAVATGKVTLAQIKATAAQKGLNVAMLSSPITWITAAIVGLVAIFVIAYNKSEMFRNAVNKLWGAIKNNLLKAFEEIKPILEEIVNAFMELWNILVEFIMPVIKLLVNSIKQNIPLIKSIISATLTSIVTAIKNLLTVVSVVFNNIKTIISTALNVIKNIVKLFVSILTGDWKGAFNSLKNIASSVLSGIKNIVSNTLGGIKNIFVNSWNSIKSITSKIWNGIRDSMTKPIRNAMDKVKSYIDKIKGFFTGFSAKIKLPHFKIKNASLNPASWIKNGLPKLSVEWYKDGGIMTQPTVFDYNPSTNTARVGGEAGDEAIAPIDTLMGYVRTAVQEENQGLSHYLEKLILMISSYLPQIINGQDKEVVLDTGALVGELTRKIDSRLGEINVMKGRGN